MMRKTFITFVIALLILSFISGVYAIADPNELLAQQTGLSSDQLKNQIDGIPKTPAEAQELLLKQSWSELISNNIYLGPVHRFFSSISPVFLILFGENYSLSFILLFVICLWFYIVMELTTLFNGLALLNVWANRGISIGIAVILAQIGALRGLTLFFYNLVYKPELWWVRIFVFLGIVLGLFILNYIMNIVEKQMKASKKAEKEKVVESEVEKQGEFIKGIKEGVSLDK